ncbi:MAG: methyltransferase domain-containing protein [Chloroflexota bacterium]
MAYTLQQDGERYLPWSQDYLTSYEHIHRYLFAYDYAANRRVLDIACGEGYGTAMLAKTARSVVGVDLDLTTLAHANQHHAKLNTFFFQADAQRFGLAPKSIDLVASFETLEHFESHEKFLDAIKLALADDGILIISTPNRRAYSDERDYNNPFHKHELYQDEFLTLLQGYFKNVQLLGQSLVIGSVLAESSDDRFIEKDQAYHPTITEIDSAQLEYPAQIESTLKPRYYLAVCSDAALPTPNASLMLDNKMALYNSLVIKNMAYIATLEKELGAIKHEQGDVSGYVDTLKLQLTEATDYAHVLETEIEKLRQAHGDAVQYVERLEKSHKEVVQYVDTLQQSHKDTSEYTHRLEGHVANLESELATLKEHAAHQGEYAISLEVKIRDLTEHLKQYETL